MSGGGDAAVFFTSADQRRTQTAAVGPTEATSSESKLQEVGLTAARHGMCQLGLAVDLSVQNLIAADVSTELPESLHVKKHKRSGPGDENRSGQSFDCG